MAEQQSPVLQAGLRLVPGAPLGHNLFNDRPQWVTPLTQGQPAQALPQRLASLFNLCGYAHHLCASLAVSAARGEDKPAAPAPPALQAETLREHLRRIHLDWPRQLAAEDATRASTLVTAVQALRRCPFALTGTPTLEASGTSEVASWLACDLLGLPAAQWLAAWDQTPLAWLDHWSATTPGWLPTLLRDSRTVARAGPVGCAPLAVHTSNDSLRTLADSLCTEPGFASTPHWHGRSAETGAWTRLQQRSPGPTMPAAGSAWLRLGARVAELVRLALFGGTASAQLAVGSLQTGRYQGLAWVEMARGLLVHQVLLDSAATEARVVACQVLAPTEWNFHPQGAIAHWLATLPPDPTPARQTRILAAMTAYDPCVSFTVSPLAALVAEAQHA